MSHHLDELSDLEDQSLFISRQVSWLAFNRRVLELAADPSLPILERVRLLGIAGDNLDSFFMKRVGALKREVARGMPRPAPWRTAQWELETVRDEARSLNADLVRCFEQLLLPALATHDIRVVDYCELTETQRSFVSDYFEEQLFPILTPLAVDPGRPFPFISNLSLSLAVVLRHESDPPLFARVKIPANRPRWIQLPGTRHFLPLEQAIASHLDRLFRRMAILSADLFRVIRSADVAQADAAADDLMDFAAEVVHERRFAPAVRLEVAPGFGGEPRGLLMEELGLEPPDVYEVRGPLALSDLSALAALELPELKLEPWQPMAHPRFPATPVADDPGAVFDAIRDSDALVHHPYYDYDQTVVAFIEAAARDPQVLAIKQSIYRTTEDSETLNALLRAAEAGKEVTALMELQARLDEAGNIAWAQRMEKLGIHTSYGFVGFKTHTRMTLVVRQEDDGLRLYAHFGTGDYNSHTADSYTDLSLFTARSELARDFISFFNFLTGYADLPEFSQMVTAPTELRDHLLRAIEREIGHQAAGRPSGITLMMNALVDVPLTTALYRASQAGVRIDLVVRGECCLRPQIPGVSDRIRVVSILGRFLEHARVFHFRNGGDDDVYIGSADWMYRNLDHRLEAIVPVQDPALQAELIELLQLHLQDTAGSFILRADGVWERRRPAAGKAPFSVQAELMRRAQASESSTSSSTTTT